MTSQPPFLANLSNESLFVSTNVKFRFSCRNVHLPDLQEATQN